jgi:hypothetical protein
MSNNVKKMSKKCPWTSCREAAGMFDCNNQDKVG